MTRKTAEMWMFGLKNYKWQKNPHLYEHVELGLKMIYDDFESETCENCKYYYPTAQCMEIGINVRKDFGCREWEAK